VCRDNVIEGDAGDLGRRALACGNPGRLAHHEPHAEEAQDSQNPADLRGLLATLDLGDPVLGNAERARERDLGEAA
jgi:hypothetical protein